MVDDGRALACVRDLLGAWNRRDWTALDELYAPNVVYESPHSPPIMGASAMRDREQQLVAIVPDLRDSDLRMLANYPASNWATFTFVQAGTLPTTLPTADGVVQRCGSPFVVHTTMFVRFDDHGRIAKLRTAHN
jgi:ketosteroid isomerase-like protein